MISSDQASMSSSKGAVEAVIGYLRADDGIVSCAAAKALCAFKDPAAASALVVSLLDPGPDMRTDAMEALIACARPDDAEAILKSLEGDPVKEVKIFAIRALAHLEALAARPLIRCLAKERAEDEVAWEDDAGMWDDWLDVQIAAIEALGHMQASEAISVLLEARTDEMGQELDAVILPVRALLPGDRSPAIRELAIPTLDPTSSAAADLVLHDRDAGVRVATLEAFARLRPDLSIKALRDPNDGVRTAALKAIADDDEHDRPPDLTDNVQAWMTHADPPLATTAAAVLPTLMGEGATAPLCRLAEMTERPIELRIAALEAHGRQGGAAAIEMLRHGVTDPTRQIQAAALAFLASLATETDA